MPSRDDLPPLHPDSAEIAYLTKYFGRVDSGIAFTDQSYMEGLSRSPLDTLVFGNGMPAEFPGDGLRYCASLFEYRRHDPVLHLVNGMGSFQQLLPDGFFPEHKKGLKVGFMHDEPAAYDYYQTDIWNRANVRDTMMNAFDGFVFVSRKSQEQWEDYAHLEDRVRFHLPNTCADEKAITGGLLAREREEVRSSLAYGEADLDLLILATVQPRKGQIDAVRSLARLRRARPGTRIRLRLVGRVTQPDYAAAIERLVAEQGLEGRVLLLGEVPKETALEHVYASDALLLTSRSEAMPLVLLEAMLIGTPIVAAPSGGVQEMVDGDCAAFYQTGDIDGLSDAVTTVADNAASWSVRTEHATRRYWSDFSNDRFQARFASVLESLLGSTDALPRLGTLHEGGSWTLNGLRVSANPTSSAATATRPNLRMSVTGNPHAVGGKFRQLISAITAENDIARVDYRLPVIGLDIAEPLRLCVPLARRSYRHGNLRVVDGTMELTQRTPDGGREPGSLDSDLLRTALLPEFTENALQHAHHRSSHLQGVSLRLSHRTAELEWIARSFRWRTIRRITDPVATRPRVQSLWQAGRRRAGRVRVQRSATSQPLATRVDAVVFVFNSPMQMMAALSLWDAKYAREGVGQPPLIALIHSMVGRVELRQELVELCHRTGRFAAVSDITGIYRSLYEGVLNYDRCVSFKRGVLEAMHPYRPVEVFISAFMSARGQKMLFEVFSDATIRLFEDGIGSYVPKQIQTFDTGLLDRIGSGDRVPAHYIRLVESVDLMLAGVPVPPQYCDDHPRIEFPRVSTGGYRIDYRAFERVLGVETRQFAERSVLLLLQNFHEHLGHRGYTLGAEREMNDSAIEFLVSTGSRVVLRPHPRASQPVWSPKWHVEPAVEVWRAHPSMPVELMIDYQSPPDAVLGVTSSALLYLREFMGIPAYRYSDALLDGLLDASSDEYAQMLQIVRSAIDPIPRCGTDGLAELPDQSGRVL